MRFYCLQRNPSRAEIQFSPDSLDMNSAGNAIQGQIRGPFCQYSRTLPANSPVRDGLATVIDPCYWTPRLPFLYEARLKLHVGGQTQEFEFRFGIRWCINDGPHVRLDSKRYVLRAVSTNQQPDLSEFRATSVSLWMTQFCESTCAAASQQGVAIVCTDSQIAKYADKMDRYPAVLFAAADSQLSSDILPIQSLGNSTPGQQVCLTQESTLTRQQESGLFSHAGPHFVVRHRELGTLAELRRECDWLQRDVAPIGQFAGYLIGTHATDS